MDARCNDCVFKDCVFRVDGQVDVLAGDRLRVLLHLGLRTYRHVTLRLGGVECPRREVAGQEAAGDAAVDAVRSWLALHTEPLRVTVGEEHHYADVMAGDLVAADGGLAAWLLEQGYAVAVRPGRPHRWTDAELAAIERRRA